MKHELLSLNAFPFSMNYYRAVGTLNGMKRILRWWTNLNSNNWRSPLNRNSNANEMVISMCKLILGISYSINSLLWSLFPVRNVGPPKIKIWLWQICSRQSFKFHRGSKKKKKQTNNLGDLILEIQSSVHVWHFYWCDVKVIEIFNKELYPWNNDHI